MDFCLEGGARRGGRVGGEGPIQQQRADHPSLSRLHAVRVSREGRSGPRMIMDPAVAKGLGVKPPIYTPVGHLAINLASKAMGSRGQVTRW